MFKGYLERNERFKSINNKKINKWAPQVPHQNLVYDIIIYRIFLCYFYDFNILFYAIRLYLCHLFNLPLITYSRLFSQCKVNLLLAFCSDYFSCRLPTCGQTVNKLNRSYGNELLPISQDACKVDFSPLLLYQSFKKSPKHAGSDVVMKS